MTTVVAGNTVGLSGCLEGEIVLDVSVSETVPAHRGWAQEITGVDGSAEISYTVRSESDRFEVFYFTSPEEFHTYQEFTLGGNEDIEERPDGYGALRAVAVKNEERDVYEAAMPGDGGRHSLTIDGTHYFVVDHSNYGEIEVEKTADDLRVVVRLEVVDSRF